MKSWHSVSASKRQIATRFGSSLLFAGLCGCVHIATVTTKPARIPAGLTTEEPLAPAKSYLVAAKTIEHAKPSGALADDLLAAKTAYDALALRPDDELARSIYDFAVGRTVQELVRTNFQPWKQPINVITDQGNCILTCPKPPDSEHDPSRYDLFPTDTLKIGGKFFEVRSTVKGIGAPLVAVGRRENPQFREHYALRRVYASVTAVIKFSGQRAQLEFLDPLTTERVTLGRHAFPLAADFTASTAMLMARERPERIGLARVLRPEAYADTARLFQLQQFDQTRTPVIFVHGLQDTPASWAPMINSLRDDPWIRKHYQFWVFSYPSGYPYPYSAMLLRHDLDGIARAFPNRKSLILVGHSMGGMISRLMITDAGDRIWRDFFGTTPAKTPLSGKTRQVFEKSLVFNHRAEVKRVVFISTPHRGSALASGWIGRIGSALVRAPRFMTSAYASVRPFFSADPAARQLNRVPNSVDTLDPKDRFVLAVNKLPIAHDVPYHSIIGDRGRGDTPNSSDGVVPYWSSHLDGAQSELIVRSDHSALRNPEAIREVERILKAYP